jgi:chromosome segregation ATPase
MTTESYQNVLTSVEHHHKSWEDLLEKANTKLETILKENEDNLNAIEHKITQLLTENLQLRQKVSLFTDDVNNYKNQIEEVSRENEILKSQYQDFQKLQSQPKKKWYVCIS